MSESQSILSLNEFYTGDILKIESVHLTGVMRRRLLDLGFVPGAFVEVLQRSPLGDPISFKVSNTIIALREEESSLIKAMKIKVQEEMI